METLIETENQIDPDFIADVVRGLSSYPKFLASKYLYNKRGDKLFQAISNLKEYYVTQSEVEIFQKNKGELLTLFSKGAGPFQLIEFGAGDGFKTKILLDYFSTFQAYFKYIPIDISSEVLHQLAIDLMQTFPQVEVECIKEDYIKAIETIGKKEEARKVIIMLGASFGNFSEKEGVEFLISLSSHLSQNDFLMIGFDLKKDPTVILKAYNDSEHVTEAFNLNLLQRMNDELGADFNLRQFMHYPIYDPFLFEARSHLVSKQKQTVKFKELNTSFDFEAWEAIHTETSKKFDLFSMYDLAEKTGFRVIRNLYDSKGYYVDSVWALQT